MLYRSSKWVQKIKVKNVMIDEGIPFRPSCSKPITKRQQGPKSKHKLPLSSFLTLRRRPLFCWIFASQ